MIYIPAYLHSSLRQDWTALGPAYSSLEIASADLEKLADKFIFSRMLYDTRKRVDDSWSAQIKAGWDEVTRGSVFSFTSYICFRGASYPDRHHEFFGVLKIDVRETSWFRS